MTPLSSALFYSGGGAATKVVAAGLLTLGGGVGGTVLYASWDPKFRATVESNVPYSDWVFSKTLGPSQDVAIPTKKKVRFDSQKISLTRRMQMSN